MMHRPPTFIAILPGAAIAGALGCAAEPDVTVVTEALTCSGFGCHDNSPIIAGAPFYELENSGMFNTRDLAVVDLRSASGMSFRLDVQQARMVGLDNLNRIALDTPGMSNAVIELVDRAGHSWQLEVVEIGSIAFWAKPAGFATTYRLKVRRPPSDDYDLCSNPPDPARWPGNVFHAILFEGDRYDPVKKTVSATGAAAAGWFNIACAGTATAKLHLARHTESSAADPMNPTDQVHRQAMLRAYTAAMCSGSSSFTVMNEKLGIADDQGVFEDSLNFNNVEALWDDQGVVCLEEQRLVHPEGVLQPEADLIRAQITPQCGVPRPCSGGLGFPGFPASWKLHSLVITTNP